MARIKLGRRQFTFAAATGAASLTLPALAQSEPIKVGTIFPLSGVVVKSALLGMCSG